MIYILIYIAGFIVSYYGWKLLDATHMIGKVLALD